MTFNTLPCYNVITRCNQNIKLAFDVPIPTEAIRLTCYNIILLFIMIAQRIFYTATLDIMTLRMYIYNMTLYIYYCEYHSLSRQECQRKGKGIWRAAVHVC